MSSFGCFKCFASFIAKLPTEVPFCPSCGCGDLFGINLDSSQIEPPPIAQFCHESTKTTTEAMREKTSRRASLHEQDKSTDKDFAVSYEDSTNKSRKADIECLASEGNGKINFRGLNIGVELEKLSQPFIQDPIEMQRLLQEYQNTSGDVRAEFKISPYTETMLEKHETTESSRIENVYDKMDCPRSFSFEPQKSLLQFYLENDFTENRPKDTRDEGNISSLDLLSKEENSSKLNFISENLESVNEAPKQDSYSSEQQIRMDRKRPRILTTESAIHNDLQNPEDPIPWMCGKCPRKFPCESQLRNHYRDHRDVKPFKCDQCVFATKYERYLKAHIKRCH